LIMEVTIPANTTATVYVPINNAAQVTESGKPVVKAVGVKFLRRENNDAAGVTESGKFAAKAVGVKFLRMENNTAVYAIGSGSYRFQSDLPEAIK